MMDDLQKLKKDYQAIKAPPYLATRVLARVADERRRPAWLRGLAVAALVLAVLGPLLLLQPDTERGTKPSLPSLSQLAPKKPPVSVSSLGSLKSVSLPPLPERPRPAQAIDTQTRFKETTRKETTHDYT